MSHNALENFERQLDALLQEHERQKQQNTRLYDKQSTLLKERDELREKLKLAITNIKKVIKHLKQLESEHAYHG